MQAVLSSGRSEARLPANAQEMVDALRKVFDASVVLYDAQNGTHHLAPDAGDWMAVLGAAPTNDEPLLRYVETQVNDRWTLYVCSQRQLHPDACALAKWAAAKLAAELPGKTARDRVVAPGN